MTIFRKLLRALEKFNKNFSRGTTEPKARKALLPLLLDTMRFVIEDPGPLNITGKSGKNRRRKGPKLSDILTGNV